MTSSKTDVEVEWLRSTIIPDLVKNGKFLEKYNANAADTFKVHDIQINIIGVEEAFMLTTCYRAKISYEYAGAQGVRSLVVKKTPPVPQEIFDSISFGALFNNEIETYTKILPAIEKFAKKTFNVPKFYYGDLQPASATVILDDFSGLGYRVSKAKVNLSLEHVLVAVKYLANFHGVCFAMHRMQPECFKDITGTLKESRYANSELHPEWATTLRYSVERTLNATRQYYPEVKKEFLDKFKNLIIDNYRYGKQRVAPVEPMVTLCHGDYLRNNVAFKYEDEECEIPVDTLMFDLQTMRLSSPMVDFTVFLSVAAYAEVRHKHFEEIFKTYCNELSKTYVEHTNEDLPAFLCHDNLLKEYISFLPFGIGISASFLMTLVEPYAIPIEEMLLVQRTEEEVIEDTLKRGGEEVDRELAHQMKEMYDLIIKYNVDVFEGFNW